MKKREMCAIGAKQVETGTEGAGWGRRGEMGDKGRSCLGRDAKPLATGDGGRGGVRTPLLD